MTIKKQNKDVSGQIQQCLSQISRVQRFSIKILVIGSLVVKAVAFGHVS